MEKAKTMGEKNIEKNRLERCKQLTLESEAMRIEKLQIEKDILIIEQNAENFVKQSPRLRDMKRSIMEKRKEKELRIVKERIRANSTNDVPKYSDDKNSRLSADYRREENNRDNDTSTLSGVWWKDQNEPNDTDEYIDWEWEYEREQVLIIQEGCRKVTTSYGDLEALFRLRTGRSVKWSVLRRGRGESGKALFIVRFERPEDREKVYKMRKELNDEGFFCVGEALSYTEKKERRLMSMMYERLEREGREVELEDRRIRVDNVWWKYDRVNGWKRE